MSASVPETVPSFSSLGLSAESLKSLESLGFTQPTPIQARAIPPALLGRDVIGCAATGTGKTAAFVLPILERMAKDPRAQALVLAPTRELVVQIAQQADKLAGRRIRVASLIGGASMSAQIKAVQSGARLLVCTPGRLVDHLQQGTVKLNDVQVLVLDEADRMLDMGFKPQLTRILAKVPKVRQTLLFSATMAGEVETFAKNNSQNPERVQVQTSGTTAARAEQRIFEVPQTEKTALLMALLAQHEGSTLVFTRTKRRADKVAKSLERSGVPVSRIHADRSQAQRQGALEGFRRGTYRVLVATDIAARGIDVANIAHVVNYDLPHVPEDYVHRIGRTARASASGMASSFASPDERDLLRDIEKYVRSRVERSPVPRESPIFAAELKNHAERQRDPGPPQSHSGARPSFGHRPSSGGGQGQRPRAGGGRSGPPRHRSAASGR